MNKKIIDNQAIEKGVLIIAGTSLISTGTGFLSTDRITGLVLVVLGVLCLIVRELVKLRIK